MKKIRFSFSGSGPERWYPVEILSESLYLHSYIRLFYLWFRLFKGCSETGSGCRKLLRGWLKLFRGRLKPLGLTDKISPLCYRISSSFGSTAIPSPSLDTTAYSRAREPLTSTFTYGENFFLILGSLLEIPRVCPEFEAPPLLCSKWCPPLRYMDWIQCLGIHQHLDLHLGTENVSGMC